MLVDDFVMIANGDMSQATIIGTQINANQYNMGAIHCVYTGSPVGVLQVQASCDPGIANADGSYTVTNWKKNVGVDAVPSGDGDNQTIFFLDDSVGAKWYRVVYTRTSGSGTLNAMFNAKGAVVR